jgi:hypothetical protein
MHQQKELSVDEEVTLTHEGETYTATYIEIDDELIICLPDDSEQRIILNGLKPRLMALTYLRSYVRALNR